MAIVPIPTTRVGDYFVRQRLIGQVQSDQLELFRLQSQISTGRRILLPSDDAPAALRAMNVQRVLQRKAQVQTNLTNSKSVLGAADASLANVSQQLNDIRAAALGVADTVSSDADRQAIINLVDAALESLVTSGNTNYKGRYLFAGSRTDTRPFEFDGEFVQYLGNEKALQNYVDLEQLFSTNIPGSEVFGGRSAEVRGDVDINPQLTADTLLSSINGGEGLGPNPAISVSITDGGNTSSSIVDLSGAVTVGDAIRLIEASGADITVDIVENGLTVHTNTGTIRISEVASGRTARELGIFTPASAAATQTVTGNDLDPALRKTTALDNLLGRKATGRLEFAGANNDLVLTANQNGAVFNGANVVLVNDATGVEYADPYSGGTLTVHIRSGITTANQLAAVINAEGTFTATPDYRDASSNSQAGRNTVISGTFVDVTTDGAGESIDTADGLILTNGGKSVTLDISEAETVEDLLNLITGAGLGLVAEINEAQTGINARSVLSGADFTIGEDGGSTATQLGIRTVTSSTRLAKFNRGLGVPTSDGTIGDLQITARNNAELSIDLTGATTLQQVIDRINNAPGNNTGGTAVLAQVSASGSGIELVDSSTLALGGELVVRAVPTEIGVEAAHYLGFVTAGQTEITSTTTNGGGDYVLTSADHAHSILDDDLRITARDGTELWVDLTDATTVQDVIDAINGAIGNNSGTTAVTARLASVGNGIELVDSSTASTVPLSAHVVEGSKAAEYLGFVAAGETQNDDYSVDGSGNFVLRSTDRNTLEVDSVFNSLIRLKQALADGDPSAIGRAIDRLDDDLTRVTFARAEVGSRLQSLDVIQTRLEDENVQLESALSADLDVDLVEAISSLTARQYALQASLQTAANILNLSLLDYI